MTRARAEEDALGLAARERGEGPIEESLSADPGQDRARRLALVVAHPEGPGAPACGHDEVGGRGGEIRGERLALGQVAHPAAALDGRLAQHADAPGPRHDQAQHGLEQGGLPAPVGAAQANELRGSRLKRHLVENAGAPELDHQAIDLEGVHRRASSRTAMFFRMKAS